MNHLSDGIVWNIIGENVFNGKNEVMENCEQISKYFKSVQTDFKVEKLIESDHTIFVLGTAEFKRDGTRLNFISACDIYEFNNENKIEKIASYCIPEKNK